MQKHLFRIVLAGGVLLLVLGFALLVQQAPGRAARLGPVAVPTWGPDIRVNPVITTSSDININYSLAVNPSNGDQIVASYESLEASGRQSNYAFSSDDGRTWIGGQLYGPWISDTVPAGDTSVAFDSYGTAYIASALMSNKFSGYAVLTGTVTGGWGAANPAVVSGVGMVRNQAQLAVDARASGPYAGSVYLAFHYAEQADEGIWLRYSRDGARTWSTDVAISDVGHEASEFPSISTASDGRVYVAFGQEDTDLFLDRSTDGGATWIGDELISGAPITPTGALDPKGREMVLPGGPPDSFFEVLNNPLIAVAPDAPETVYAVWNDGRWDSSFTLFDHTGQHGDIAFSRTTDSGSTWSAPVRINDDGVANGVDQWQPNIAVGPGGRIGVTFYDRRDDSQHALYHRYYTESNDGGSTWSANQRISDVASDPMAVVNFEGGGIMGDYVDLVYGPDYALPSWVDSRAGRVHDVYVDRGAIVLPPNPTPTATETPCAASFSDVQPTDYFYTQVRYLACRRVVSGYGDGTFRPYNQTTRGQLSKMVVLGFGWPIQTPASPTFVDVPASHPFYAFVETAAAHNVISGYTCGGPGEPCPGRYFRPAANVTRGQLAKMVVEAKGWSPLTPPTPTFADVPAGHPFYGFVERAYAEGVLSGYGCGGVGEPCPGLYFRPANDSTRGQLSKILYNVLVAP